MTLILNNWQLKLISVMAAFLLWFFVVGIENTVSLFPESFEVQPVQIAKNVSLSEKLPTVKLYLRADKEQMKNLTKTDFEVSVDLSDFEPGDYNVPVVVTSKNSGITIVKVDPAKIFVHLAPIIEKEVPVEVLSRGIPAVGYRLDTAKPEFEKVKIAGRQSVIQNIKKVEAYLIFDGSEKSNVNQSVALTIPGSENFQKGSIQITPEQMVVTATIIPEKIQATTQEVIQENPVESTQEVINTTQQTQI